MYASDSDTSSRRYQTPTTLALTALRHGDHDFSLGVSCFKIPQRFSSLMQWVASIDHRRNAPGLDQLLHERQILLRWVLYKGTEPLPMLLRSPRPQHHSFEKPTA